MSNIQRIIKELQDEAARLTTENAELRRHLSPPVESAPVIVDDNDGQPMVAGPQPAPAFKVGDRVVVADLVDSPVATVLSDNLRHYGCGIRFDNGDECWEMYANLLPAAAEAKPQPAKVDTLQKLTAVFRDALGEQWAKSGYVADAIHAHIVAMIDAKGAK